MVVGRGPWKARSQKWVAGMRTGNRQNGASYANDDVTQYYPPGQGAIDNASARIGLVLRSIARFVLRHLLMAPRTMAYAFIVAPAINNKTSPPPPLPLFFVLVADEK